MFVATLIEMWNVTVYGYYVCISMSVYTAIVRISLGHVFMTCQRIFISNNHLMLTSWTQLNMIKVSIKNKELLSSARPAQVFC
jgi:hypothetical protein